MRERKEKGETDDGGSLDLSSFEDRLSVITVLVVDRLYVSKHSRQFIVSIKDEIETEYCRPANK